MRKYELTYLISDVIPESDLNKVSGKVAHYITILGGSIIKEDIWGRRKLAYPIRKQDFATYITTYFELPAQKVKEFEHDLKLIDGVLRHLTTVTDYGQEKITLSAEDVAITKDIEDVVGGEKSFEAIVGMTEGSKDLMAKREKEETIEKTVVEEKPAVEESVEEEKTELAEEAETVVDEETKKEVKAKKEKAVEKKPEAKAKKTAKAKDNVSDEVDRLSKLNEELDGILKDEL